MVRRLVRSRGALVALGALLGAALSVAVLHGLDSGAPLPSYEIESPDDRWRYFRSDADLGYGPVPGVRVRSYREMGGARIYDVRYTIDEHGLRTTPGSGGVGPAIVFFGGSFTFGEGVEDDETLPARTAAWLGDGTRILNAGFHGYGPHQMLRSLETGRLDPVVADGVEHVLYQGIPGHVPRAAGRVTWDLAGPRYELGADGRAVFEGAFRGWAASTVSKILHRFGPTRALLERSLVAGEDERERDEQRYVEIVARAAELADERWGARFTVIFWDEPGGTLADRLEARGLDVLRVSDALDGVRRERIVLGADRHPNRWGHSRIARAVARHVRRARRTKM